MPHNEQSNLRILPADDEAVAREVKTITNHPLIAGKAALKFVAIDRAVMQGQDSICTARSHTMARRIANALQEYIPGEKGY